MARQHGMIEPFKPAQSRQQLGSWSGFGFAANLDALLFSLIGLGNDRLIEPTSIP